MATKHDLHVILFKWLQTLDLSPKVKSIEELSDGVVMARALNQIDPEWFPDSWLSKIKTDTGDNWRLKLSNLKKILEQVFDYYQECFNQPLLDFKKPDVVKIGDKCDPKEIGRLLQLILGCAVNCVKRQEYIEIIMTMNESEQRVLMECIQELDSERALSFSQSLHLEAPQLDQLITQLNDANMARDKLSQRCNELELQVQVLQEEKDAVVEERKKLQDEIESNLDSGATALRRQLEQMKGELFKLETSRDDYKQRCEDREKETLELRLRLEELGRAAAEARNLKDELDVLRDTADKVEKYEATIATYKKKLEETADLRREVKQLEAKNMSFIQQNIEMEEELKKASFWKAQFEAYKKQVSELEERLDAEAARGDKLSYELTSAEEQLNTMRRERERLIVERDSLRESVEELRCRAEAAEPEDAGSEGAAIVEPGSAEDLDASNAELRQRLLRLRRENARLRQGASEPSGDADSLGVLQTLLEDTRGQLERVRREYREANQKILQLEGELRDARGGVLGTEALARLRDNGNGSEALGRLADAQQALERERRRHAATIEDREQQLAEAKDIIGRLRTELAQKDIEIQEADDKYKKYVEKARSMLKVFEEAGPAQSKAAAFREQLLATSYHALAATRHRESVEQRLSSLAPQTFLSRQRANSLRKQPARQ